MSVAICGITTFYCNVYYNFL